MSDSFNNRPSEASPFGKGNTSSSMKNEGNNSPLLGSSVAGDRPGDKLEGSSSTSFGNRTSSTSNNSASHSRERSYSSSSRSSSSHSWAGMAFLIVGVTFLATVLIYIVVDRFFNPKVELPSQVPIASEVQEWNKVAQEYSPNESHSTAIDPVSKQAVDPKTTPYKIEVYGTWFYFANEANLKTFVDDPLTYLKININVKLLEDKDGESVPLAGNGATPSDTAKVSPGDESQYLQIPMLSGQEANEVGNGVESNANSSEPALDGNTGSEEANTVEKTSSNMSDSPSETSPSEATSQYTQIPPPSSNGSVENSSASTFPGGMAPQTGGDAPQMMSVPNNGGMTDGNATLDGTSGVSNANIGAQGMNGDAQGMPNGGMMVPPPGAGGFGGAPQGMEGQNMNQPGMMGAPGGGDMQWDGHIGSGQQ